MEYPDVQKCKIFVTSLNNLFGTNAFERSKSHSSDFLTTLRITLRPHESDNYKLKCVSPIRITLSARAYFRRHVKWHNEIIMRCLA